MKRIISLLLVLCLFLPALSLAAELDEEELTLVEETEDLDEEESDSDAPSVSAEVIASQSLTEEEQDELRSALESADYIPRDLDAGNLYINENILQDNIINILLLGVDTRQSDLSDEDVKLADVQMILSIDPDNGTIKLSSILRDTLVVNPFSGKQSPINYSIQSYDSNNKFHDNPQRAIATVNYNFEMNIQYYIMINFRGVAAIVDKIGGIDLELTEGEAANINYYLKKNAKKISRTYDNAEAKAARVELEVKDGVQHLDGLQALMYARLRQNKTKKKYNLGDDWQRTFRTRNLLDKLLQKVLKMDFLDIVDLAGFSMDYVDGNLNLSTMINLITQVMGSGIVSRLGSSDSIIEQFRIPAEIDGQKTWAYVQEGEWYGKIFMSKRSGNFQKNIEALHEFIYGTYYPAD